MQLQDTKSWVERLLRKYPKLRTSDDYLYGAIVNEANAGFKTCNEFFKSREALGVPSYETVSRCRRKLQEQYEELRAPEAVQQMRMELADQFRDFSRT